MWAPAFRSVNALMEEISGLSQADHLSLVFDLYQSYMEHHPMKESFDDFYFWGEMLLSDFDDVDKNLVDAQDLFRNVNDIKEIDYSSDYLSEKQKEAIRIFWQEFKRNKTGLLEAEFEKLWTLLYPIYESFKMRLQEKSVGYEGMIFREAASLIRKGKHQEMPFEKYAIVGFNALSACEKQLFKHLQNSGKAMFFWDYDDYYLDNNWHEAGAFMRDHIRQFPPEWHFDSQNLTKQSKYIEIVSVPSNSGQAKLAGQILDQFPAETDWDKTAIVLTDEHLLSPILSSIPERIKDINITMGYPFVYSPANSLFERLASLQLNIRRYADGDKFYHNDATLLLHHPYIQDIMPDEANAAVQSIVAHNRIYVPASDLPEHSLIQLIFRKCADAKSFLEYLSGIVAVIIGYRKERSEQNINEDALETYDTENDLYQLEYLFCLYTTLQRMGNILIENKIDMELKTFCRLLRQILSSVKIPFSGEPLKGLQIMGMLETRVLDFERVIVLSMNEGIYPKSQNKQSFIPYHLRQGFGMTTLDHYDSINAYHFYRLLQRAEDIRLIYNSASNDANTGERSRYLTQLIYEPPFNIHERKVTFRVSIDQGKEIVKERNDSIQNLLSRYYAESEDKAILSPTALNVYLDCRLRFYFRYIEGLSESEKVMDEIDPSVFGLLLHKTMELIYQSFVGKAVTEPEIGRLRADRQLINQLLLQAFAQEYFHTGLVTDQDITGRNIIVKEVLLKYIDKILEIDQSAAPFEIIALEKETILQIPVCSEDKEILLNMRGYIDRLDYIQGTLRVIDYKTGNAKPYFKSIDELFDRSKGNHAAMQTLTYAYMMRMAYPEYQHIRSELYLIKDLFSDRYNSKIGFSKESPIDNYRDVAEEFEGNFNNLLSEIFLSDQPFVQTEDTKKCRICPYAQICHRN